MVIFYWIVNVQSSRLLHLDLMHLDHYLHTF